MPKQYPSELRQRAVRLVAEQREQYQSEYEAIRSIASRLGITTPETLRKWVRQAEIDSGRRSGTTSEESAELRKLRAEVKELRRANEILKAVSAFFAAWTWRSSSPRCQTPPRWECALGARCASSASMRR